ncbi:hypothetical protein EG68_10640 [Paragonimus skrjabini miyazakii]|uniref:Uncharacterized protein n=1 Tax=Paragonimus skrjabini miyazakii TaxID=59628 RepID=A0A8S9YJX5_9TREM|nr:hypothetical protein EG68_10640 [Paragonimus skrjabini miyazakii]
MSHTSEVHSSGFNDYNRLAAIGLIQFDLKTDRILDETGKNLTRVVFASFLTLFVSNIFIRNLVCTLANNF